MKHWISNKRIKTITCHDVYNFGASLQAFALMRYLQELGHQVEIIDYKPDYLTYNLWAIGKKWKRNIFMRLIYFSYVIPRRLFLKPRRKKFDLFTKNMLDLTHRRYRTNEELKNNPPLADIFLAGSDQIWNTEMPNGKDPAFYLDFVPVDAIKASYAASFATSQIANGYVDFVKDHLRRFDAISVREETGLNILKSLGIEEACVVLDPVFLLNRNQWFQIATFETSEKYLFVYDQENNSLIKDFAQKIAEERKLKIYAIQSLYLKSYADKRISNAGPKEFLGLIKNCEFCLTNSFHCIAFSLIFQKEFFLFKRMHEKVNSRMIDLLNMLKLNNRIIESRMDKIDLKVIDYYQPYEIMKNKIDFSRNYINSILEKSDASNK